MNLRKYFGVITIYNGAKNRNCLNSKTKIFWRLSWNPPMWLLNQVERISFENIYIGSPEDYYMKHTGFVVEGSRNVYWLLFRDTKRTKEYKKGDWKWCFHFFKYHNDHVCCSC